MTFSFEVKESDLLGRLGLIRVGGKTLETPFMFPVIHPVNQSVSTSELKELGFGGLMTNSYIIHSRRREEALRTGIHGMLGFDGVFMTDSGGYQVLEYGDLEVEYGQVADFQSRIGSELAVTLDRPTGYPQPRAYASDTMQHSLANAVSTLKEYGDRETTWVGPVQGGLYQDLVRRSAKSLVASGFEFLALGSPVQVMENYMFTELVKMIIAARSVMPYHVPLHLFGAGHPLTMALAVALGCDTFDSASYILFARSGRYMTRSGVLTLASMKYLPCSCPVCLKNDVRGLLDLEHPEMTRRLALHNLYVLREEMESCREAIAEGRLWDLVEEKAAAHPRLQEAFKELSRHQKLLMGGTRVIKDRGLLLRSAEDLDRPELAIARERLRGAMRRSSSRAVIQIPKSSASRRKKRVSSSPADAYRMHSALGPYPVELDFVFPFTQTVASAELDIDGAIKEAATSLRSFGYRSVGFVSGQEKRTRSKERLRSRPSRRGASPSPP